MRYSRLTGVIYVIGSIFGLLISLGGLLTLWATKQDVTQNLTGTVALVGRTLTATRDTIGVVSDSLEEAETDLDLLNKMIDGMGKSMDDSGGLIRSTADLVGVEMVGFVNNTQTSLTSVQSSARVVDDFLGLLSSLPLIGARYKPDVPLEDSIALVKTSMDPLPDSLLKIQRDLDVSAANVATLKSEMDALAKQVGAIEESLSQARKMVEEYRAILSDVQARYDRFQDRLPVAITITYLGLTGLLIWMLMTQIGMLINGIGMLG